MVSLIMNTICTVIPRKGWLAMIKHGYDIPVFWGQKYPCLWGQKYECMCYSSMPFFAQSLVARGKHLAVRFIGHVRGFIPLNCTTEFFFLAMSLWWSIRKDRTVHETAGAHSCLTTSYLLPYMQGTGLVDFPANTCVATRGVKRDAWCTNYEYAVHDDSR
jgi:hypothetical protein